MIRQMHHPEEIAEALDLIWETFLQFDAPDYCDEGVSAFRDFIGDEETIATLEFWGARRDDELIGVIATNEHRKHICCFFVKSAYRKIDTFGFKKTFRCLKYKICTVRKSENRNSER